MEPHPRFSDDPQIDEPDSPSSYKSLICNNFKLQMILKKRQKDASDLEQEIIKLKEENERLQSMIITSDNSSSEENEIELEQADKDYYDKLKSNIITMRRILSEKESFSYFLRKSVFSIEAVLYFTLGFVISFLYISYINLKR